MDILTSVISVFITSIVELWIGIPLGLFLDLNPLVIAITAAAGSILSAFMIIMFGDKIRKWFIKWHYGERSIQDGRFYDIWNKYGIIGLGLLSPLLFGSPLGAALGIGLGAQKDHLFIWMSLGIIIWSVFLTSAGYFGLISFQLIIH